MRLTPLDSCGLLTHNHNGIKTMNPSGYCGRGRGYGRSFSLRGKQPQPGHSTSASGQPHCFSQGADSGYRRRPLSRRSPQHYPRQARAPEPEDITKAFRLLRTNPWQSLDAAEVLLDKYRAAPSLCVSVCQLKARALFQLGKIDDCIAFINSLDTRTHNDKTLLMTKARALQTRGFFNEALPLFQHLYVRHQVAYKDHKAHGLGLGRLLQLMGGDDNLQQALTIFTRLRTRAAAGRENTPCDDKDIELTLGRHLALMGGPANLQQARAVFTRLRTWHAGGRQNTPCGDKEIELSLGRHLQLMGGLDNMQQALDIFTRLRIWHAGGNTPCNDKEVELSLGRHLELMGGEDNLQQALAIFTRMRTRAAGGKADTPCNDKDIELTLGRLLQLLGGEANLEKAQAIFRRLRTQAAGGRANTPCNDKDIELALGRHLQLMGGAGHREALAIFTRLRTSHAAGKVNTPCHDKEIELALGRVLQLMGGTSNLKKALAIFTRLRTRVAGGRTDTPCNDKDIELTLGRHLQLMGGRSNLDKALAIFTRLRTRAAAGKVNTPCDDKDIELAIGRLLELRGAEQDLEQALTIFTRLRTRAAGGRKNTPCQDKDIELAWAGLLVDRQMWPQFDELQLEARLFPGFEPHLCLSIRYFRELGGTLKIAPGHSGLLGKAIKFAVLAIEAGGFMNASCISQLAHSIRLLSYWPDLLLQKRGLQPQDVSKCAAAASFLFDTADEIAPWRQRKEKNERWRAEERALLALLS